MVKGLPAVLVALGLLGAPTAHALGPLERNPPKVAEGLTAYDEGRYDDALQAFDEPIELGHHEVEAIAFEQQRTSETLH